MNVYFNGNYWGDEVEEWPCRALDIQETYTWDGFEWFIPGAYVCERGIVLDLCKQVSADTLKAFLDKWKPVTDKDELTASEKSMMEYENPLKINRTGAAWINGKEIKGIRVQRTQYSPFQTVAEAETLMDAYKLDKSAAWCFARSSFKWDDKRIPGQIEMKLKLSPGKYYIPCAACADTMIGENTPATAFTHPFTGSRHLLFVEKLWQEKIPEEHFQVAYAGAYGYPCHYQGIEYYFDENTNAEEYMLRDCEEGDHPVIKEANGKRRNRCCAVGIIGGSSGPASVMTADETDFQDKKELTRKTTFSRLKFEPVERTRWQIEAIVERQEEKELEIKLHWPTIP